jgi:hypothetical protein
VLLRPEDVASLALPVGSTLRRSDGAAIHQTREGQMVFWSQDEPPASSAIPGPLALCALEGCRILVNADDAVPGLSARLERVEPGDQEGWLLAHLFSEEHPEEAFFAGVDRREGWSDLCDLPDQEIADVEGGHRWVLEIRCDYIEECLFTDPLQVNPVPTPRGLLEAEIGDIVRLGALVHGVVLGRHALADGRCAVRVFVEGPECGSFMEDVTLLMPPEPAMHTFRGLAMGGGVYTLGVPAPLDFTEMELALQAGRTVFVTDGTSEFQLMRCEEAGDHPRSIVVVGPRHALEGPDIEELRDVGDEREFRVTLGFSEIRHFAVTDIVDPAPSLQERLGGLDRHTTLLYRERRPPTDGKTARTADSIWREVRLEDYAEGADHVTVSTPPPPGREKEGRTYMNVPVACIHVPTEGVGVPR